MQCKTHYKIKKDDATESAKWFARYIIKYDAFSSSYLHLPVPLVGGRDRAAHHQHIIRVGPLREAVQKQQLLVALVAIVDGDLLALLWELLAGADERHAGGRLHTVWRQQGRE